MAFRARRQTHARPASFTYGGNAPSNDDYFDERAVYVKGPNDVIDVDTIRAHLMRLLPFANESINNILSNPTIERDFEYVRSITSMSLNSLDIYKSVYDLIQSVFALPDGKYYPLASIGNFFTGCRGAETDADACALPCPGALTRPGTRGCKYSVFRAQYQPEARSIEKMFTFISMLAHPNERANGAVPVVLGRDENPTANPRALLYVPNNVKFYGIPAKVAEKLRKRHILSIRVVPFDLMSLSDVESARAAIDADVGSRSFDNDAGFVDIDSLVMSAADAASPAPGAADVIERDVPETPAAPLSPAAAEPAPAPEPAPRATTPTKTVPFWVIFVIIAVVLLLIIAIFFVATAGRCAPADSGAASAAWSGGGN